MVRLGSFASAASIDRGRGVEHEPDVSARRNIAAGVGAANGNGSAQIVAVTPQFDR